MRLVLAIWLASSPCLSQIPPAGAPVSGKPVDPFAAGLAQPLPLTPELLKRWGYDVDKVLALPPDKRLDLQKELTLLEIGRLRRLSILQQLRPDDWRDFVDEKELLTAEGMRLVDEYLAKKGEKPMLVPARITGLERKDGKPLTRADMIRMQGVLDRMFDGVSERPDASSFGREVVVDAHVRDETLYSLTLTNPKSGFSAEVGQLYVDGRHPNADNSWYGNLTYGADSEPDSWVDYRFKAQLGYVDLHARYFADSGNDPSVTRLLQLGQDLGLSQAQTGQAARYLTYDDPYKAHGIIVTSMLAEIGRAYNLYGPLDLVWTAGNLTKVAWIAPNTAFDETTGLRVRLNKNLSLGFFGGVTENVSPVGAELLQEVTQTGTVKPGFYMEKAPHASVALWGKVPGVSDLSFSLTGSERLNEHTTVHQGEASLMTTFQEHPLALRGIVSVEKGKDIEFDRRQGRLQLDYQMADRVDAYLAYERDHIRYGNANVDSDAFMLGIEMTLGGGNSEAAGSVAVDQVLGGVYQGQPDPMKPYLKDALDKVNRDLVAGLDVADQASKLYDRLRDGSLSQGQIEGDLNRLSLSLQRLDPTTAGQLMDQLAKANLSDAQKNYLADVWQRTAAPGSPEAAALRQSLAQSLGGNNLKSDLFWLQGQGVSRVQQALGAPLPPAQQRRLSDFFGQVAQAARDNPQLSAAQLQRIDDQGLALLSRLGDNVTQAQRQRLTNLFTQQARDAGALIQKNSAALAGGANRILGKIDDASAFYQQHKAEIRELVGLLTNEQVWDAVVIQAGRAELISAMNKLGKVNVKVPVLGDINLQFDAPAMLAASNILQSRLSPLAPVKAADVDAFLLRQGGEALGLGPNATDQQLVSALFGQANAQIEQQLSQRLGPLIDQLGGKYDPAQVAQKILAAVPPQAAQYLKQQYGADLSGLLPANLSTAQLKTLLTQTLPGQLTAFLNKQYGAQLAQGLAAATSWAGELLSRQINMTLIQMLLASEELNRLSVDHGRKLDDLDLRFAMRSFDMLDARGRERAVDRLHDVKAQLAEEAGNQEARLADRIREQGREQLQSLQLDPSWPAGLTIAVDDESLAPIWTYYGDGAFFDLLERIKARYLAKPRPGGLRVAFAFDAPRTALGADLSTTSIWHSKGSPDMKIVLGRPKNADEAAFRLKYLENYVDD